MTRPAQTRRERRRAPRACAALAALALAVPARAGEETALADAAMAGDAATVRALVDQGADVDAFGSDGTPALHWVVREGDADTARLLIAAGADPSLPNRYLLTPLHVAAAQGDGDMIALLLDAGGDPNAVDYAGEPVLLAAARDADADAVGLLLDRGAEIDKVDEVYGQTALMVAAREGDAAVVRLLIDRGADIEAQGWSQGDKGFIPPSTITGTQGLGFHRGGWPDRGIRMPIRGALTPLLYAVREGRADVVEMLVEAGADVNHGNADNMQPLLMAIMNQHLALAHALMEHGADVTAEDWYGQTPLWSAIDVRNLDMRYDTPMWTMDNGVDRDAALALITEILERGADPDVRVREYPPDRRWINRLSSIEWVDVTGQTSFLRAAVAGDVTVMRLLLDYGADPNIATFGGTTPLMSAAGMNWNYGQIYTEGPEHLLEAVEMCWELGNDVNAVNDYGLTAAHAAANRGSDDIIRFLHEKGAALDLPDAHGRTPMDYAEGVFLATHAAVPKPSTIALLGELLGDEHARATELGEAVGDL